jgi:polyhydroxybutyrate depolymerase
MKNAYLLIFLILAIFSCKKAEDIKVLPSFQVFVIQGVNDATLIWDPVHGYSDSVIEFELFLNDSLIAGHLKLRTYKIVNLSESSEYKVSLSAISGNKKVAEQSVSFSTLTNQAPKAFSIYEIAIKNNSVSLKWSKSDDPENDSVKYDIFLNNQLKINGMTGLSCEIAGLNSESFFLGEIIARDLAGNSSKEVFTFRTIKNDKSKLVHRFFKYQGYKRDFAYYLPASYDSTVNLPLVISLHGANGNAWDEINSSDFKTIADRENFILLMPQALLGSFNGETLFQWNAHYIFPWDDVSLLNQLIDYMYTEYHVDLSKVFISGMSNGGFMTFFAARGLQDRIAAIAPIAGLISDNVFINYSLNRSMPLCYMHGTADQIVWIDGSLSADTIISFFVGNNKCTVNPQVTQLPDIDHNDNSTVTLYQYNGYSDDSEIQYYKIIGGGHSVPGVEPGANMDINAYEVIWSFFSRHSYLGHSAGKIVKLDN